jgi:site-specific recombinase XerD
MSPTSIAGTGERRRYHLHASQVQKAVEEAATKAANPKRVSPHTFRHTFASHPLLVGYDRPFRAEPVLGRSPVP